MFDDLHDPDPPRAGLDTLARVSSRAKTIRRRRSMAVAASSLAVVALVAVAVVPNIGDDRGRISTVDDSVAPTPSTVVVDTTIDRTIDPAPSTTEAAAVTPPPTSECTTVPRSPAYLVDGSVPGEQITSNHDDGTSSVQWGSDETVRVIQRLGADAPFVRRSRECVAR